MCFVWISEQTAIISLYNINWLVCITEKECVYCAVRTGCLSIIQVSYRLLSGLERCDVFCLCQFVYIMVVFQGKAYRTPSHHIKSYKGMVASRCDSFCAPGASKFSRQSCVNTAAWIF
jgi:hypothetical protein